MTAMVKSDVHDDHTKKVRRRIEEHLRKNYSKEQIFALAIILGINVSEKELTRSEGK